MTVGTRDDIGRRSGRSRPTRPGREVIATVAIAGFSVATMIGWIRVFDSWAYLTPVLVVVFGVHGSSLLSRLAGVRPIVTTLATTVFGAWLALLVQFGSTFRFLLPTGDTLTAIGVTINEIVEAFPSTVAPVEPTAYWVALAVAAAWLVATAGDSFAFGAGGVGEALVPGALVFVIVAALGADRHRLALSALLVAAGIVAVGALGWHHDRVARIQVRSAGLFDATALTVVAAAIATGVFAAAVTPYLPGAGGEPVVDPKNGLGGGSSTAPSPLLDIRSRLNDQSDEVMFRVDSEREAYWRLTTVAEFDGNTFGFSDQAIERVELPDRALGDDALVQRISIAALDGYMVPAAAEPRQAEGTGEFDGKLTLRVNSDSATLVSPRDHAPGDSFLVVSQPVDPAPDSLRDAGAYRGADPVFLDLPSDLPSVVAETARSVTDGQPSDYDRLVTLQDWFRDNFDYSTDIDLGQSSEAMAEFLDVKTGYCVQFATTFAAMARSLGVPSRVAVGYTPGTASGAVRTVTGRNAHAWPEVLFEGIGWVAFEPTPGRGIPGAELYTGVPAQQDSSDVDAPPVTTAPSGSLPNPAPTTAPNNTVPNPSVVTVPVTVNVPSGEAGTASGAPTSTGGGNPLWWLFILVLIGAAVAVAPSVVRRVRRSREGQLDVRARSQAAWSRCQRSVRRVGVDLSNASTDQWLIETRKRLPSAADAMELVGRANDFAVFAPEDAPPPEDAALVSDLADEVESAVNEQLDRSERARAWLSMR